MQESCGGGDGVPAPSDPTLKAAVQLAALHAAADPQFESSVAAHPAYHFIADSDADGYAYYRFCLEACRLQAPLAPVDLRSLLTLYREPSMTVAAPLPPAVLDVDHRLTHILPTGRAALHRLVEAQPSVDACVACIRAAASSDLNSMPEHRDSAKLIRQRLELEEDFAGRLTLGIVAFLLMSQSASWVTLLRPYLFWLLRLTSVAATTQHQRSLVTGLLALNRMEHIIGSDDQVNMLTLLEAPTLPDVSDMFSLKPLTSVTKRKSRFDVLSPVNGSAPKRSRLPDSGGPLDEETTAKTFHTSSSSIDESSKSDPDLVPVGLLASLLKQVSKRSRNIQAAFVPYRPLDPLLIPLSSPQELSSYLLDRLTDLKEDIEYELKPLSSDSHKSPPHRRRTHEFREPGGAASRGEAHWEKPLAWAQEEMGIGEDGSTVWKSSSDGRLGLGASNKSVSAADSLFDEYRRQRAQKYHQTIAQAHSERHTTEEFVDASRICYICQKPGHIARECKFGLS